MPLEGVGSKFMIHKSTDFTRDASALAKRAELMQQSAQRLTRDQAEMQGEQVVDVSEASEAAIRRERERRQRQKDQEREAVCDEAPETEQERPKNPFYGPQPEVEQRPKKIDIRI